MSSSSVGLACERIKKVMKPDDRDGWGCNFDNEGTSLRFPGQAQGTQAGQDFSGTVGGRLGCDILITYTTSYCHIDYPLPYHSTIPDALHRRTAATTYYYSAFFLPFAWPKLRMVGADDLEAPQHRAEHGYSSLVPQR